MFQRAFVVGICCATIIGCSATAPQKTSESEVSQGTAQREERAHEARNQVIASSIKQLEQQNALLSQSILGRQQKISALELQKNQLEIDLRAFNGKVEAFIMDNIGAITCMQAVGATLDESNQYSKDTKDIAATATVVCGIAVLANSDFRGEVFSVVDQLAQADSHAKNLSSQINAIQSELATESAALEQDRAETGRIASEIQTYQSQLEVL
jgi:hypothetical protein